MGNDDQILIHNSRILSSGLLLAAYRFDKLCNIFFHQSILNYLFFQQDIFYILSYLAIEKVCVVLFQGLSKM